MDERQLLPYTPTDAGRVPKIKNFGLEGGWATVFPVVIAGACGIIITFLWVIADAHLWPVKMLVGMSPLWASVLYVKLLIAGKPPAYRHDVMKSVRRLRLDWRNPVWRWLPIVPRLSGRHVFFTRPQDAPVHPLIAAARELRGES